MIHKFEGRNLASKHYMALLSKSLILHKERWNIFDAKERLVFIAADEADAVGTMKALEFTCHGELEEVAQGAK